MQMLHKSFNHSNGVEECISGERGTEKSIARTTRNNIFVDIILRIFFLYQ